LFKVAVVSLGAGRKDFDDRGRVDERLGIDAVEDWR
jgi:hypothetical protein